jgi:hypothetical protein
MKLKQVDLILPETIKQVQQDNGKTQARLKEDLQK